MATSFYTEFQSNIIVVNGIEMSMADYKKMKRGDNKTNNKRRKKQLNEIQLLPDDIKTLMRGVKVFRSLVAFYTNGYRQWGNIHKQVMDIADMGVNFALAKISIDEVNNIIDDICNISKKREKSVYAYVQKLSYKMNDAKLRLQNLYDVVMGTNIINSPFANHEIINGEGRRLGLKILMRKTINAVDDIDYIINNLNDMAVIPNEIYNKSKLMSYEAAK